jgi:hypothetical protein
MFSKLDALATADYFACRAAAQTSREVSPHAPHAGGEQNENPADSLWRRYFDASKGLLDVEVTSQLTHSIALKKKIATIY